MGGWFLWVFFILRYEGTDVEKDAILTQEDATAFGYENVEQLARAIVGDDPRNVWRDGNQIDTSVELDGNDKNEVIRQLLEKNDTSV